MINLNREVLRDKIHACWIGKNIGGTMGTPYEGRQQINDIQGFSTPEGVVLPNDDLDLQLVWLRAMEDFGPYTLDAKILGEYWLNFIPPQWNEYGIGKNNMRAGLMPPLSGEYENDWKHSNGAWIRTEVWACMAPAAPDVAIRYAREDACVDHGAGEGTYAAIFVAAMESAAFVISDIRTLIDIGLSKIPADCRMAQSIRLLLDCYDKGLDWKTTRNRIVEDSADLGWFEAPANVAFAMLGMLYGKGDFKKSMILAINCGDDTDCTGATLGSLFGIMYGSACIPADWAAHIGDHITTIAVNRGSLYGLPETCTALSERVYAMIDITYKANRVYNVRISDDAASAGEDDIARFYGGAFAKALCEKAGKAYTIDFIWGSGEVCFASDPVIAPGQSVDITVHFRANPVFPDPKHLRLRWLLPDGFTVSGGRRDVYLPANTMHTYAVASQTYTVTAGDCVEAANRLVLEVSCNGRPTVGYLPVVLLG
ncbi:MAG: ADP-ribosylglycohydrolase family protein [Eubacteriales bacterium]